MATAGGGGCAPFAVFDRCAVAQNCSNGANTRLCVGCGSGWVGLGWAGAVVSYRHSPCRPHHLFDPPGILHSLPRILHGPPCPPSRIVCSIRAGEVRLGLRHDYLKMISAWCWSCTCACGAVQTVAGRAAKTNGCTTAAFHHQRPMRWTGPCHAGVGVKKKGLCAGEGDGAPFSGPLPPLLWLPPFPATGSTKKFHVP